ncbi:MAG: hypothetical protein WBA45_08285 [Microthrixaceae bacterium]
MPTQTQRDEFEGSFSYHVGVLMATSRLYLNQGAQLANNTGGPNPQYAAADALFEMILVRVRSFDSFLGCVGNQKTDAHATDWVPGWQRGSVLIGTERNDISKRLPHLTYLQPPVHQWPIGEIVRRCCEGLEAFLFQVGPSAPKEWEDRHIELEEFLKEHATQQWNRIWTENDNHAHRRQ